MIAVDTSALVAILRREPERAALLAALTDSDRVFISPGTIIEATVVAHRRGGPALVAELNDLLAAIGVDLAPIEQADLHIAQSAIALYGKGSGHPAALNYGDLFSYALAKSRDVPLLYKGDDFVHTDIVTAA